MTPTEKQYVKKLKEIIHAYSIYGEYNAIIDNLESDRASLEQQIAEEDKKKDYSHLCCICHNNWVDSDNGFDTCATCLML